MRDALGVLDQVISTGNGRVEYEDVVSILGLITNEKFNKAHRWYNKKDIEQCVKNNRRDNI